MSTLNWNAFLIGFVAVSFTATAAALDLPGAVAAQAEERIEEGYHLATVIGIVDSDGAKFYGFGRLSEDSEAIPDEDTLFEIGSITKTFTATLLADLELQGVLRTDDPVSLYVPTFQPTLIDSSSEITLEHLSNHTAGLPREAGNVEAGQDNRYSDYSEQDLFDYLSEYKKSREIGRYSYSNVSFMVLESAIEQAAGLTYEELLEDRVLSSLGMESTSFHVEESDRFRHAVPYRYGQPVAEQFVGEYQAMGGIRSSARDMLTYLAAQVGIIDSSIMPAMRATHSIRYQDDDNTLSLGWSVLERDNGKTIHFHSGGTNGYVSWAGFDLDEQIGVVVLNSGRRYFSDLGFHILDSSYPLADPE